MVAAAKSNPAQPPPADPRIIGNGSTSGAHSQSGLEPREREQSLAPNSVDESLSSVYVYPRTSSSSAVFRMRWRPPPSLGEEICDHLRYNWACYAFFLILFVMILVVVLVNVFLIEKK